MIHCARKWVAREFREREPLLTRWELGWHHNKVCARVFSDYIPGIFHLKRVISTYWAGNIIRQKRNLTVIESASKGTFERMC